jgi:hypothetical protein
VYCSQCGTQLPDEAAFCHSCGARIAVAESRADEPIPGQRVEQSPLPGLGMASVAVPGWVRAQLLDGESVLAKASGSFADYYATDRRLLRFTGKSNCEATRYSDVSITLRRHGWGWHLLGLFAVAFSVAVAALGVLMLWGPTIGDTDYSGPPILALVMFGLAASLVWVTINFAYRYYQISIWREDKGTPDNWRFPRPRFALGNPALDRFAAIVEERSRASKGVQADTQGRPHPLAAAGTWSDEKDGAMRNAIGVLLRIAVWTLVLGMILLFAFTEVANRVIPAEIHHTPDGLCDISNEPAQYELSDDEGNAIAEFTWWYAVLYNAKDHDPRVQVKAPFEVWFPPYAAAFGLALFVTLCLCSLFPRLFGQGSTTGGGDGLPTRPSTSRIDPPPALHVSEAALHDGWDSGLIGGTRPGPAAGPGGSRPDALG